MKGMQAKTAQERAASSAQIPARHNREKASRFALLGMLSFGGYRSGYDLKKAFASSAAHFWNESYGNIYPRLRELAEEGLIRPHTAAKAATGRQKQLYAITSKGRQTLAAWLTEPVVPRHEDNELLLKLFFASKMPAQATAGLVAVCRMHHQNLLAQFDQLERSISDGSLDSKEKIFLHLTVEYGRAVSKAIAGWAEQTERKLNELSGESSVEELRVSP